MRILRAFLLLVLLTAVAAGGTGWWAWQSLQRPLEVGEPVTLDVVPGTGASAILADLEDHGLVVDRRLARLFLVYRLGDPPLKAGEYRFEGPVSTVDVLDKLIRGEVVQHRVTVIEGLTLEETAEALAAAGFGNLERFLAAMRDPAPIADLDPEAATLEGYLYPDTYAFTRGVGEREIVGSMVRTFRQRFEEEVRPALLGSGGRIELVAPAGVPTQAAGGDGAAGGADKTAAGAWTAAGARDEPRVPVAATSSKPLRLTLRELVTLASIVEKEAQLDEERPLIASVYVNRLLAGMGLYADPTVIYALKRRGEWDGNLRRDDLDLDSPYNTYRYGGLPPGPIASPGLGSLRAAADPAPSELLYFVSRNDGSHVFAKTLGEHNRNVREWQKRYWKERWARERRERQKGDAGGG